MIAVVTVTYGNRWEYLQQMISPLLSIESVSKIVVVDNGSSYDLKYELNKLLSSKITLLPIGENRGSAFGFKHGIEYLLNQNETSFIYLLDDDNVIQNNALGNLQSYWESSNSKNKTEQLTLLSLRNDRRYLVEAARGESQTFLFPNGNLFLGFDFLKFPLIILSKIRKKFSGTEKVKMQPVKIPMAPYGGFFFHRNIISKIGLPDEKFFSYSDDFDFTYRITETGGSIWLVPESVIQDVSINKLYSVNHSLFKSKYLEAKGNIAYFSVRNPTYFLYHKLVKSKFIFRINIAIYTCYLFALAIFAGKLKQFKVYLRAVNDGLKANLDLKQINNEE